MTLSEKAWESVDKSWHPHSPTKPEEAARFRQREALRALQQLRLPIKAIDLITAAIAQTYKIALEETFCPNCGVRGDETDEEDGDE